jgi:hypothetical protein
MRRSLLVLGTSLALAAGSLWLAPAPVAARKQTEVRYGFDRVWNATLRLLRVDLRFPITDRDPETGYVLFDYMDHGKRYAGSVELMRVENARPPSTRVVVQVQGMPGYVEQMIVDKLGQKLRDELGEPVAPAEPPKKPAPTPEPPPAEPPPAEG